MKRSVRVANIHIEIYLFKRNKIKAKSSQKAHVSRQTLRLKVIGIHV